jgi:WD40 repeat protein
MCIDVLNGCVVTGSIDRVMRVYDTTLDMELVQSNAGHTDAIRSVVHIAARGQYMTASWDQTIRTWNSYVKSGRRSK